MIKKSFFFDEAATEKNNVLFSNYCWQMFRTTDTGGVRLIYYGIPNKIYNVKDIQELDYDIISSDIDLIYDEDNKKWIHDPTDFSMGSIQLKIKKEGDYVVSYEGLQSYSINDNYISSGGNNQVDIGVVSPNDVIKISYLLDGDPYFSFSFKEKESFSHYSCDRPVTYDSNLYTTYNYSEFSLADVGYMYNTRYVVYFTNPINNSYYYGHDVIFNESENKYYLNGVGTTLDNNHHYSCLKTSQNEGCEKVVYFYEKTRNYWRYVELDNGKEFDNVINEMLHDDDVNKYDSKLKNVVDSWYENNIIEDLRYKIDDTIYCNDRSAIDEYGWLPDGELYNLDPTRLCDINNSCNYSVAYKFKSYPRTNIDLYCEYPVDRFTTHKSNGNGSLKYPIAVITDSEINLSKNAIIGNQYHTMSPFGLVNGLPDVLVAFKNGGRNNAMGNTNSVKPVLTLKNNAIALDGDGSMNNPFQVREGTIIVNSTNMGDIELEKNLSEIKKGQTVRFRINLKEEYKIEKVEILDQYNNSIEYRSINNNEYEFTMPDTDVTIKPIYRKVKLDALKNPNTGVKDFSIMLAIIIGLSSGLIIKKKNLINS